MLPENIFKKLPSNSHREIFELLEHNEHIRIERIISDGRKSPATGWYDQQSDEWVLLLAGNASIEFEDGRVTDLVEGDYLTIRAHVKHRVLATGAGTGTLWLAIHY